MFVEQKKTEDKFNKLLGAVLDLCVCRAEENMFVHRHRYHVVLDLCVCRAEENPRERHFAPLDVLDLCICRAEENTEHYALIRTDSFRPMCL